MNLSEITKLQKMDLKITKFRIIVSLLFIGQTIYLQGQTTSPNYFITTWNTEAGDTGSNSIKLPIVSGAYDVDTSYDGMTFNADMSNQSGIQTIDFTMFGGAAGMHTIAVRPNPANNTAGQLQINHGIIDTTPEKLSSIGKWGNIVWTSMAGAFRGCSNMTLATDAGVPDLTEVTNMTQMFLGATNLTGDLSGWNVSNVTDMSWMFNSATSFTSNLSSWNVSSVANMAQMFDGAPNFTSDLSSWDVSNVTDMENMLTNATSFSRENYDALLTGWSSLSLQPNVVFGAPSTVYCAGKAGRDILTDTYNWSISGDTFSCPVAPFVATWNTEAGGQDGSTTIVLPISGGAYDVDINNDGDFDDTDEANNTGLITIDFQTAGIYTIVVRPNAANTNNQLRINYATTDSTPQKLMSIDEWGGIVWTSMASAFRGCSNMILATNVGVPDLTEVTNMSQMFLNATDFTGNLSSWNVSNVTSMRNMFGGATNFTGNLSSWDVSNVTSMSRMFDGATSFTSDLRSWNVSKVTDMSLMFVSADSFTGDLSTWNVSNVTSMDWMFSEATNFTGNLSSWDVSSVTNMAQMFDGATSFTSDLSTWDVSNVTNMTWMFSEATSFTSDLNSWNVSSVGNMNTMFYKATSFTSKLSSWNVSNATSMSRMFDAATSFTSDLNSWNVSKVTDMSQMFYEATSFTSDLNSWNVSNVTDMDRMFYEASSFNGNLSSWNVSNVNIMWSTFEGATRFNKDLSSWDVSSVVNMTQMFDGATNFTSDLNSWNVSNVTSMVRMFDEATSFNGNLSTWDVSNVTDMGNMFYEATSFSRENYDALLTGWSSLPTLQNGVEFGAPPTTYCAGKAGRDTLTNAPNNWTISGDTFSCPTAPVAPFVTTWNTQAGDPGNATIMLPISGGAYDVDTSYDGTTFNADMSNQTGTIEINFGVGNAGEHTIAVRPNAANTNNQLRINYATTDSTPQKLTSIDKWGGIVWTSMRSAFRDCSNMTIADNAGVPNLTVVTSMESTFSGATNLTGDLSGWNVSSVTRMDWMLYEATSFNGNLSTWDVSNVTDMDNMFSGATSFNSDLSNWNVSNVTSMRNTFDGATSLNRDLSSWDVSKVTDMRNTFRSATSFNSDLSTWNVSQVTDMAWMFYEATNFTSDLRNWNVSKVTDMNSMFFSATSFNKDLSTWNVSQVTDMAWMFYEATSFTSDLSNWNVSKVTDMNSMFFSATSLNRDLSSWNVSNVTNMVQMFYEANSFNSDISTWNVSNVTDMENMFSNATSFSRENYDALLTGWSSLPSLHNNVPFRAPPTTYCNGKAGRDILTNAPNNWTITGDTFSCPVTPFVTTWNTEKGTGQDGNTTIVLPITSGAYDVDINNDGDFDDALDKINLIGVRTITLPSAGEHTIAVTPNPTNNTNNRLRINHQATGSTPQKLISIDEWGGVFWTSMRNAFRGCSNMTLADTAGTPNLTEVTNTSQMFYDATNFNGNLSTWNVSNVTDIDSMFFLATNFNSDLNDWDVSNVNIMRSTFEGATNFNGDLSSWNVSQVTDMISMFFSATSFNGDLSTWNVSNVTDMDSMFFNAISFNSDLNDWDVSNVNIMWSTFEGATNFNSDLSSWNVSSVANMLGMFFDATSFNSDLSSWNVSSVANMSGMFQGATSFSAENYDALLAGWSSLPSLQDDVVFGAPPTTYCAGKAGRDILTGTYNWSISGDSGKSCSAISVDEEFLSNTKIYPNPTGGKINIESSFEIEKLELYNILGAKIFSVSKTNVLDLTNLSQGIYILKVFSSDRVVAKKVIKD